MNCKVCQNLSVKNPDLSFFRFPSDYDRCRDWAERCDILPIFDEYGPEKFYKSFRICSEHFDSKYVVFDGRKKKLLSCAVPKEFHRKEPLRWITDHSKKIKPQPKSNSCFTLKQFRNLCRFCAEEDTNLIDIFSWKGKTLKLEEKIKLFPITVRKQDELPLRVCRKCVIQLTKFYEFINMCMTADIKLKKILRLNKNKLFGNDCKSQRRLRLVDSKKINEGKPILQQDSNKVFDKSQPKEKYLLLKESKNPELPKTRFVCFRPRVQQRHGQSQILGVNESKEYEGNKQEKVSVSNSGEGEVSGIREDHSSEKSVEDKNSTNEPLNLKNLVTRNRSFFQMYQQEYENSSINRYICRYCFKHFCSSEILESHEKAHSLEPDEQGKYICQTCGKEFPNRFRLNEHNGIHTGECPFKCPVCNKRFHKRALLRQHVAIHDPEKRYACSMCNLRSNRKGNIIQHVKNHFKKLQNEKSDEQKNKQEDLATSETTEYKRRKLSTESWNIKFIPQEEFLSLRESNNKDSQCQKFKFICGLCREQYLDLGSLEDHFKIHTGENPKSSHSETTLKMDEDQSVKTVVECEKSIKTTARKRKGDERNFQCEECGIKFKRKDTLIIHLRIHTGERPYMCKKCGFAFKQRGDCLKHERNHSDEDDDRLLQECKNF